MPHTPFSPGEPVSPRDKPRWFEPVDAAVIDPTVQDDEWSAESESGPTWDSRAGRKVDWVEFGDNWTANVITRGVLKTARPMRHSGSTVSYFFKFLMEEEGKTWPNRFILSWRPEEPDRLVWTQPKQADQPHLWHGNLLLTRCAGSRLGI